MAKVLLIEDTPINLELMSYLLRSAGHEVVTATNGEAGLAALADEAFDLVACDLHMPKVDGYEVVRAIRSQQSLTGTKVIAVTGSPLADGDSLAGAGFDGHVAKPIELATFVAEIEVFLLPSA